MMLQVSSLLTVEPHGSIVLFRPLTDAMNVWLREHTEPEATWWDGALVVETRYADDLIYAIRKEFSEVSEV